APHWSKVRIHAQRFSNSKQASLGPLVGRRIVELGQSHRAQQRGIRIESHLPSLVRKWIAGLMDGDAAQQTFLREDLMPERLRHMTQHFRCFADNFYTDSVTGQQ